ncbi:MAG: hypothetical protein ACFFCS_28720 [Candidatus Hodarchaeota archaeon]
MTQVLEIQSTKGEAIEKLNKELKTWLEDVKEDHLGSPWMGKHDEGTFLTSWREYEMLTGDEALRHFALGMYNLSREYWKKKMPLGYYDKQEVHHGVEHHTIFLAWILEMMPGNEEVKEQLRVAANHIVEKGKKKTEWLDPSGKRFKSTHLGTKHVGKDGLNIIEHLRLVRLAWLGLASGGNPRLKDFILDYSMEWAEAMVNDKEIPVYLDAETEEMARKEKQYKDALSSFMGAAPQEITPRSRAEIHVANGSPGLFIQLHEATGKKIYLDAADRILERVKDQLFSPYAHPIGELLWKMHDLGRFPSLKGVISPIVEAIPELDSCTAELVPRTDWNAPEHSRLLYTVGIRRDMPELVILDGNKNKVPAPPSPGTLVLVSRLLGDDAYQTLALEIARITLLEARRLFLDGRMHGCGSESVLATCVGHGRNWGAGYVSTAMRGMLLGIDFGITLPRIK